MWSHTVEYALRAMVYLSTRSPNTCTTEEIAAATHVPKHYLSKVLQLLARSGLVQSHRGLRGGINLARSPEQMTVHDIISAVDVRTHAHGREAGLTHGERFDEVHRRIHEVLARVEEAFETTTLVELAEPHPRTLQREPSVTDEA
ncbi:MAG: Rrf2 family transcriptional regulator [Planctomycetes bacterium]|nr:Rrf2 family transcriptional regulator [Planctomycetota bacterium]